MIRSSAHKSGWSMKTVGDIIDRVRKSEEQDNAAAGLANASQSLLMAPTGDEKALAYSKGYSEGYKAAMARISVLLRKANIDVES